MSEKKHIDRIFQERFKDFEETPGAHVWSTIEAALDKKEKKERTLLPIWWKLGGVAAVLAIAFLLFYAPESSPKFPENNIIVTPENGSSVPDNSNKEPNEELTPPVEITDRHKDYNNSEIRTSEDPVNKQPSISSDAVNYTSSESNAISTNKNNKVHVAATDFKKSPVKHNDINKVYSDPSDAVAETISEEQSSEKITSEPGVIDTKAVKKALEHPVSNAVSQQESSKSDTSVPPEKKSLLEAVEKDEETAEEKKVEIANSKRWSVRPNIAPVYFDSFGQGSPLDASFVDNSKSGNVHMSYGVNVAYEINKRFSIRSGVNKVTFGYDTNEIAFSPSHQSIASFDHITVSGEMKMAVFDKNTQYVGDALASAEISAKTVRFDGVMTQELGYIEVPLEMEYRFIDKKLGLRVIGGVSSLFLTDNEILLASEDRKTSMGKANNVNNVNFSTNVGIGVDYNVSENLKLNVEPMLKYQLNTFSDGSGNFQPYSLGVYTGFSFRF